MIYVNGSESSHFFEGERGRETERERDWLLCCGKAVKTATSAEKRADKKDCRCSKQSSQGMNESFRLNKSIEATD